MTRKVVITGLGSICGLGVGVAQFWDMINQGQSAIRLLSGIEDDVRMTKGAWLENFQPDQFFMANMLPLLDRFSQFAVVASKEAIEDAGLAENADILKKSAAIIGTGCGGKQTDEETYSKLYKEQRTRVHPLTIPKGMPSAAASMVSLLLGIKGPVFSIASACASAAHAIIQGRMMIQAGLVDVAVVGGTDAPFTYGLMKSWDALRVVSNDTCRPFSANRSGMVLGEGAGMLILESEQHASQRGARVYAELAGCGMSSDAGHITRPDPTGIADAIKGALDNANIQAESVDYINAHGTGTIANDKAETDAVHHIFDKHANKLAISSTKSMHGHALGASSALELIATTLAVQKGRIPPTANFTDSGEGCDLDYVPNIARDKEVKVALSNSFAFGGLNAVIALRQWSADT